MNKKLSLGYVQILLSIWALGIVITLWRCLSLCDGHLIYTLDDPYIHLSVAENILQGGYGVNAGEYSAPCSSIIYPFILAGTEWIKLGSVGPLIINLLAMGGAVYILGEILEKHLFSLADHVNKSSKDFIFYLTVGILLCFIMGAWGLVFTGMEHSIHILLCLAVFFGFLQVAEMKKKPPLFLYIALILLPLIRFEGLALSIFGIMLLYYLGHRKNALISIVSIGLLLILWGSFMHLHHLPFFPSSVQLKSQIISGADVDTASKRFYAILNNILTSLSRPSGRLFYLSLLILSVLIYKKFKLTSRSTIHLSILILFTGMAHGIFGKFGGNITRYEIYASILICLAIFLIIKNSLKSTFSKILLVIILFSFMWVQYGLHLTIRTPIAAKGVYEQQYQMHRFVASFWKRPVAVNDLGLVSYHNNFHVLDLYGLGSEEVRLSKVEGSFNAPKINELVIKSNVGLIMIYDDWFNEKIPSNWIKIATLKTSKVTSACDSVQFYLTNKSYIEEAMRLLNDFSVDLPSGSKIIIEQQHL
jgi:hypothetical protein